MSTSQQNDKNEAALNRGVAAGMASAQSSQWDTSGLAKLEQQRAASEQRLQNLQRAQNSRG